jgi:DOMON domain
MRACSIPLCSRLLVSWMLLLRGAVAVSYPYQYFGGVDNQVYMNWVKNVTYPANLFVASDSNETEGIAMHWDIQGDYLYLAVAARASGFVGFGIADAGGMEGADMLLYETLNPDTVRDAHVLDVRYPITDESQDWEFIDSVISDDFLIVEVKRLLDTGDPQDRAILHDDTNIVPTRIIGAWGESTTASYHGPNRARGAVRFRSLGSVDENASFKANMAANADGYFEIGASNYSVKPIETEIIKICMPWKEILAQGVPDSNFMVIGFEPIVDKTEYVHHINLFANDDNSDDLSCDSAVSWNFFYGWASGSYPLALPGNVGSPWGAKGDYNALQLVRSCKR